MQDKFHTPAVHDDRGERRCNYMKIRGLGVRVDIHQKILYLPPAGQRFHH